MESTLYKQPPKTTVRKQPSNFLKLRFENKEAELPNLHKMCNHTSITFSIPKELPSFGTPLVIYTLEKSTQSKILN